MNPDDELIPSLGRLFELDDPNHWPERGLLRVNSADESVSVVQPKPCDCHPISVTGPFAATDADCNNPTKADEMIHAFRNLGYDEIDALSPRDLNNVACALIWQSGATPEDAQRAYDLLIAALDRADDETKALIFNNLISFGTPITPGTPQPLYLLKRMLHNAGRALDDVRAWMIEADRGNG